MVNSRWIFFLQPIQLVLNSFPVCKGSGKFPPGTTEIPFVFILQGDRTKVLYETYHGVFINIQYFIKVDMKRGLLAKDLDKSCEFIVEYSVSEIYQNAGRKTFYFYILFHNFILLLGQGCRESHMQTNWFCDYSRICSQIKKQVQCSKFQNNWKVRFLGLQYY